MTDWVPGSCVDWGHNADIVRPVDYNSWVESDKGRKLTSTLDKDVVLAEGSLRSPHAHEIEPLGILSNFFFLSSFLYRIQTI